MATTFFRLKTPIANNPNSLKTKSTGIKHIRLITLGCSKNTVDSEHLAALLVKNGFLLTDNSTDNMADAVIVNTCGFVNDAKEQSIDVILENLAKKKDGKLQKVYAIGCLSQRYKSDLQNEMPDLDGIFGLFETDDLIRELGGNMLTELFGERILTTPPHYAYLKISDGCNRKCSFCAIPLIKGKLQSRSIESLVEETTILASKGVKEIILIAQDLTAYGRDFEKKHALPELINELSNINGIEWIRLHYSYPTEVTDKLIETIRINSKVCKYLDIPLQHISDRILHSMKRGITKAGTYELITKLRDRIPGIRLRTSLITGYPGETTAEYLEMKDFIKKAGFERLGIFKYSHEEDTPAFALEDNVSPRTKESRYKALMEAQQEISYRHNQLLPGKSIKVLVDRIDGNKAFGRTEFDSPEIDNMVIITGLPKKINSGQFVNVKISSADIYDLFGEVTD